MIAVYVIFAALGICLVALGIRIFVLQYESPARKWFHPIVGILVTAVGLIVFSPSIVATMLFYIQKEIR